jgi:hypothetical protein
MTAESCMMLTHMNRPAENKWIPGIMVAVWYNDQLASEEGADGEQLIKQGISEG